MSDASIHPSAVVDPGTKIGKGVFIGPFTVVGPGVDLGDGVRLHSHVAIEYTTLGANSEVYPQASLGYPAQHLRYKGEPARLVVGSGTVFREGVTAHRGSPFDPSGESVTRIGDNCYFMAASHIAHDCRVGNNVILANAAMLAGHTQVGDNSFISASVGLHQWVRVGRGALVSGGAMVPLDVAPFCIAQGDRASLRGLNIVGMRRLGFDRAQIKQVKEAFKTVFLSGLRLEDALIAPELNVGSPAVTAFRDFLSTPKRGFIRPAVNFNPDAPDGGTE